MADCFGTIDYPYLCCPVPECMEAYPSSDNIFGSHCVFFYSISRIHTFRVFDSPSMLTRIWTTRPQLFCFMFFVKCLAGRTLRNIH